MGTAFFQQALSATSCFSECCNACFGAGQLCPAGTASPGQEQQGPGLGVAAVLKLHTLCCQVLTLPPVLWSCKEQGVGNDSACHPGRDQLLVVGPGSTLAWGRAVSVWEVSSRWETSVSLILPFKYL